MAWRAILKSTDPVATISDSVTMNVEFQDPATGRAFQKSYKLVAGGFQQLQAVRDLATAEVAQLTKLDQVAANLQGFLNQRLDQ